MLDARCERPQPTSDGLKIEGVAEFSGDRWTRVDLQRQHLRDLLSYEGQMVAIASDDFPEVDGFYELAAVSMRVDSPFPATPFSLELRLVGSANDTRHESRLIGSVATNDYALSTAEQMHAPPVGHTGYDPRHTTAVTRLVAYDSPITVYRSLLLPTSRLWAVAAADYYRGAATILRRDATLPQYGPISGDHVQAVQAHGLMLTNGIVRFWSAPGEPAAFEIWNGSAWTRQPLAFVSGGDGVSVGEMEYVSVLVNRPDRSAVRYERAVPSGGLVRLDVSVSRGEQGLRVRVTRDVPGTLGVTSGVVMTQTSNRLRRDTAVDGVRLVLATLRSATFTPATGRIEKAATLRFDAYLSAELVGALAGDQAAQLGAQYLGANSESVRTVRR